MTTGNSTKRTVLEVGALIVDADTVVKGPAYVIIENGKIHSYGSGSYRFDGGPAEVIALHNRVAMPGLINTHGHAAMTLFRGAGDDVPLQTWLSQKIYPLEQQLTAEAVHWGTLLGCWEMMLSGTTCFTDMYFHMDESARAVDVSGLRGVLSIGLIGFTQDMQREGLRESERFAAAWNGAADGRIHVLLGPHAPYTCPPTFLEHVTALSAKLHLGIQIHLSETELEVEESLRQYGRTPVAHVKSVGLLERPVLAAHCVHVTDEDLALLKQADVRVAHNPQSNLKLGSGVAPLVHMQQAGLTVGLGTDGAASNNNLDMFEEMRLAATLHKGVLQDATVVTAKEAFAMATTNGARAVFRPTVDGTLRPGADADVVLLDLESPRFQPAYDLISNVVYAASAEDVQDVWIGNQWVVRSRQVLTLDTERIRYEVKRFTQAFNRS